MELLIKGCLVLTMDEAGRVVNEGYVAVRDGVVVGVGRLDECPFSGEEVIDARGKLAMPGLVNAHTHSPMTLLRGVIEDLPLEKWLKEVAWPIEANLRPDDVYWGSLLGCVEMARSGVTCFNDQYFFMDRVAEAVRQAGLRGVLSHGVIGYGKADGGESELKKGLEFAVEYNGYADGRVVTRLGPHAEYSCDLELLLKTREQAKKHGLGIHMHFAEYQPLYERARESWGGSPAHVLDKHGFWGRDVIIAHAISLDEEEIRLLARRGVSVAYNPVSNMKIASGTARVVEMLKEGLTVSVGTDGPASNNTLDLLKDLRFASYLQKHYYKDPAVIDAKTVVRMATINGANALGLGGRIGSIEPGKHADVILIDLRRPHLSPLHDPYALVAYSASGHDVSDVIVSGRVVVRDRRVLTVDEEAVVEKAADAAHDLLERSRR